MVIVKNVKYTLFFMILLLGMPTHALNLDETVDDEIRKNYNSNKLLEDVGVSDYSLKNDMTTDNIPKELPKLPNIVNKTPSQTLTQPAKENYVYNTTKIGKYKINKHTSFAVTNNNAISDSQREGTKITFKTQRPFTTKNYVVPAGSIFYGEIVDSHTPQISCNGGLVVITIYAMKIKGETTPINAYITKANGKHIFLNNIKGKRTYLKTVYKKGNWGRALFGKMLTLTVSLGKDGSTLLLAPFPFLYGTICLGANTIISPVTAFFSKGGRVYIPAGSSFKIKFEEDVYID